LLVSLTIHNNEVDEVDVYLFKNNVKECVLLTPINANANANANTLLNFGGGVSNLFIMTFYMKKYKTKLLNYSFYIIIFFVEKDIILIRPLCFHHFVKFLFIMYRCRVLG